VPLLGLSVVRILDLQPGGLLGRVQGVLVLGRDALQVPFGDCAEEIDPAFLNNAFMLGYRTS
jgi:hypothetical protein